MRFCPMDEWKNAIWGARHETAHTTNHPIQVVTAIDEMNLSRIVINVDLSDDLPARTVAIASG